MLSLRHPRKQLKGYRKGHATWERACVEEPGTTTVSTASEEHTETITASPDKTVSQPSSRLKLRLTDLGLECVLAKVRAKKWRVLAKKLMRHWRANATATERTHAGAEEPGNGEGYMYELRWAFSGSLIKVCTERGDVSSRARS